MNKRFIALLVCVGLLFTSCSAVAENVMKLPSALKTIGERAFYYDSSISTVEISDGTTSIGPQAFAHCSNLVSISVPATVTYIADNAFDGIDLTKPMIFVTIGSYAETWFKNKGFTNIEDNVRDSIMAEIVSLSRAQLGKGYVYGAHGENTFDCSGFVYYIYHDVIVPKYSKIPYVNTKYNWTAINSYVPHKASSIATSGAQKITNITDLQVGDIVCFDNGSDKVCDHVGIVVTAGATYKGRPDWSFIHASTGPMKVIETHFYGDNYQYYVQHFMWGRRLIPND